MEICFVNHTKKQFVYVGEGEDENIMFVFSELGWKISDKITMLRLDLIDEYDEYECLN